MDPDPSGIIQVNLKENFEKIESLGQEIREICSLSKDLLKEWLINFQKENNVEISVEEYAVSYYDSQEVWKFSENCSDELEIEVAKMETLADELGWDLKSICKRLKK